MINHYVLNFSNYTPYHILPTKSLKSWLLFVVICVHIYKHIFPYIMYILYYNVYTTIYVIYTVSSDCLILLICKLSWMFI